MTTCLGKSCSFGLSCVSFVNVYQFLCASFSFGMKDLVLKFLIIAHFLIMRYLRVRPRLLRMRLCSHSPVVFSSVS